MKSRALLTLRGPVHRLTCLCCDGQGFDAERAEFVRDECHPCYDRFDVTEWCEECGGLGVVEYEAPRMGRVPAIALEVTA